MDLMPSPARCLQSSYCLGALDHVCPPSPTEGCRCSSRAPEQDWRQSEKDQWKQLAESRRQRAKLANHLWAVLEAHSEQALVLQRREHELGLSWS